MKNDFGFANFTVDGKCSGCGSCCSDFLPISKAEIQTIKRYIKKHNIKAAVHLEAVMGGHTDFTCPFRDNEKKICTIYEVRPAICRVFSCDQNRADAFRNRDKLIEVNDEVSMRNTFFGDNSSVEMLNLMKVMIASGMLR